MSESFESFSARVLRLTGVRREDIPVWRPATSLAGTILATRTTPAGHGEWVTTSGYPDAVTEDGEDAWSPKPSNFERAYPDCDGSCRCAE